MEKKWFWCVACEFLVEALNTFEIVWLAQLFTVS